MPVPSDKLMLSTVTKLAVNTFFELKLAVPLTWICSAPTNPAVMVSEGVAVVVPSYTLLGALTLAVKGAGVMNAAVVWPALKL